MTYETPHISDPVKLGAVSLGRAFALSAQAISRSPHVELTSACDPDPFPLQAFKERFEGGAFPTIEELLAKADCEAVYIASPHQLHAEHARLAAKAGKHVLIEKPIAIDLEDALEIVALFDQTDLRLLVGPSHGYDGPVELAADIMASGDLGNVRMVQALNYTDFMYRPRRREELVTSEGGGVIFSQLIHQIDIVRRVVGTSAQSVYAVTGDWDPKRTCDGACTAILKFAGGVSASLTYSGYAHFDSNEWMGWIGELGQERSPDDYGRARASLALVDSPKTEQKLKQSRVFGQGEDPATPTHHEHFGPIIVVCDKGDLRLMPDGVWVYGDKEKRFVKAPLDAPPRTNVFKVLHDMIRSGHKPFQSGASGVANLEICHAILKSSETGQVVVLQHQSTSGKTGI